MILKNLISILNETSMIASFVFVMMLVIEYVNILTSGKWKNKIIENKWGQYVIAAFLGATPGCLGAFVVVALYSHRIVSIGAVVAAMIATSGDETFVMLALIPKTALWLILILSFIGIIAGVLTDMFFGKKSTASTDNKFVEHISEIECKCLPEKGSIIKQLKNPSLARGGITVFILFFLFSIGIQGALVWNWKQITFIFLGLIALFIVLTVPEHFLKEHLWDHLVKKHLLQIVGWTFLALLIINIITNNVFFEHAIKENIWGTYLAAAIIGIIPSSGPHLIFVTMFAKHIVPFSILLTSSIIQDGHGMIPLLAFSRKDFFVVKFINIIVGCIIGGALLLFGF